MTRTTISKAMFYHAYSSGTKPQRLYTLTRTLHDCRDVEHVTLETLHGVVFANGEPMEQSEDAVRRMVRSYVGCAE